MIRRRATALTKLLYNASVLAHYAQVSTQADVELSAPANLSAVFCSTPSPGASSPGASATRD